MADVVDRVAPWRAQRQRGVKAVLCASRGQDAANSAEHQPPLRPDAPQPGEVRLDDDDAQRRVEPAQVVRRPEPGVARADDAHIGVHIAGQRRPRRQVVAAAWRARTTVALDPLPGLGQHRAQDLLDLVELLLAADERRRELDDGSPRSSARQIRPASNSAPDRKPRSRRSLSSSSKVSLVALSLTSSMP